MPLTCLTCRYHTQTLFQHYDLLPVRFVTLHCDLIFPLLFALPTHILRLFTDCYLFVCCSRIVVVPATLFPDCRCHTALLPRVTYVVPRLQLRVTNVQVRVGSARLFIASPLPHKLPRTDPLPHLPLPQCGWLPTLRLPTTLPPQRLATITVVDLR